MPVTPEPLGAPPELVPFLRWLKETLLNMQVDLSRKAQADTNTNAAQSSTMTMLVDRLGAVTASINAVIANAVFSGNQITSGTVAAARIANLSAAQITSGALNIPGNITTAGHIYVPNSTIASFGSWTVAYVDGDGRLTRGASSARFKVDIVPEPLGADYFSAQLSEFSMKDGNGWRVLGYIAEDLLGTDMERFVVWERAEAEDGKFHALKDENGDPIPLSIDWIPLLLAQNTQLKRELESTTGRVEAIEARLDKLEEK